MQFLLNADGVHASGPFDDHTLCGDSITTDVVDCVWPEITLMRVVPPQNITCKKCREVMVWCRRVEQRLRQGQGVSPQ